MTNYFKNKLKDRLNYCQDWKHSIDLYLANKEITKQADEEFYKPKSTSGVKIKYKYQ